MRDESEPPTWRNVAIGLVVAYVIGSVVVGWPLMWTIWPRDFPDLRPYLVTAAGVCVLLLMAVLTRSRRLAVVAAVVIPVLVSAAWHALEVRWNSDLQSMAASGDPAAIAMVLRGRSGGWLWAVGPATVAGSFGALLYAFYCMWKLDRADTRG